MTSLLKVDIENCAHRITVNFPSVKGDKKELKAYLISLFNQATSEDVIKITIVNTNAVTEHYTSEISRHDYEIIKRNQNLLTDFDYLLDQIKSLLIKCEKGTLNIKLKIDDNVELIFFTMTDVKELILVSIPFEHTSQKDLISFLLKKDELIRANCKMYHERSNDLQQRLDAEVQQNKQILAALEHSYEEIKELERKCFNYEEESQTLRKVLNDIDIKNKSLENELKAAKKQNSDLNYTIDGLCTDVESLKIGIEYYVLKNNHLQNTLAGKEKLSVPLEKYEKLSNMLSSAIADVSKYQMNVKHILMQNKNLKSDNSALKEELMNCKSVINHLEEKLNKFNSSTEEEDTDVVSKMIAKLETQTATCSTD